jgi:hypothetical protein
MVGTLFRGFRGLVVGTTIAGDRAAVGASHVIILLLLQLRLRVVIFLVDVLDFRAARAESKFVSGSVEAVEAIHETQPQIRLADLALQDGHPRLQLLDPRERLVPLLHEPALRAGPHDFVLVPRPGLLLVVVPQGFVVVPGLGVFGLEVFVSREGGDGCF